MNSKKEGKKESEKNKLKRMISYTFFFFFYENDNTPFSMFHMHMSKISELTSRKIDLFLYNAFKKKKKKLCPSIMPPFFIESNFSVRLVFVKKS